MEQRQHTLDLIEDKYIFYQFKSFKVTIYFIINMYMIFHLIFSEIIESHYSS